MRNMAVVFCLLATGCASQSVQPVADAEQQDTALLFVSLEDGRVVMQQIEAAAEVCWKLNEEPSTVCYEKGEPVFDPATNRVIAYEMAPTNIDLYAAE